MYNLATLLVCGFVALNAGLCFGIALGRTFSRSKITHASYLISNLIPYANFINRDRKTDRLVRDAIEFLTLEGVDKC